MIVLKMVATVSLACLIIVSAMGAISDSGPDQMLFIKVKARAVVLGPDITLGDVIRMTGGDKEVRLRLLSIKIGKAPPPGESTEVQFSHIKQCLKIAGFEKDRINIKGPRRIRVSTAQMEIDKAFIKEEFASLWQITFQAVI